MTVAEELDAIVIGGGPAGSVAANVLAQAGRRVAVLEKSAFPRYHVGESLLPYGWWTLDRIGVLAKVEAAGFQRKRGVRFVSADGRMSRPFRFGEHLDHDAADTWQVDRAVFDRLLLDHAGEHGARVMMQTSATALVEEGGRVVGVDAVTPAGPARLRAPWTVDCSGRDGFVRTLRGWRNTEKALDRIALWAYYQGVSMDAETAVSTTVIQVPEDGWLWFIPMANGITSVGVVARRDVLYRNHRDREAVWAEQVAKNPWLDQALAGAERTSGVDVTADYSYRSSFCADDGVVLAGDAFAFLDPVFSSGVFLALRTGEEAARGVLAALDTGRTDAGVFAAYGEWVCRGIEAMRSLVFSFYDPDFNMGSLIRAYPDLRGDVTDLLIGNLFREYDALNRALDELADVPGPLPYGRARVPDGAAGAA